MPLSNYISPDAFQQSANYICARVAVRHDYVINYDNCNRCWVHHLCIYAGVQIASHTDNVQLLRKTNGVVPEETTAHT